MSNPLSYQCIRYYCYFIYVWVCSLVVSLPAAGQVTALTGRIVAESTDQPVPFATVSLIGLGCPLGVMADQHGRFQLAFPLSSTSALSLQISSLGYEVTQVSGASLLTAPLIIRLKVAAVRLEQITVHPSLEKQTTFGRTRGSPHLTQSMYTAQNLVGQSSTVREMGACVRVSEACTLQAFNFEIAFNTFDHLLLELLVYEWVDGRPGRQLSTAGIPVRVTQKRGWVPVDLRAFNLQLAPREAIFISLQLRRADTLRVDRNAFVLAATPAAKQQFLVRTTADQPWQVMTGAGANFFLTATIPVTKRRQRQRMLNKQAATTQDPTASPALVTLQSQQLRTLAASDTSFADLALFGQQVGTARVVLLGEPTHGEGTAFAAKARLVRYLQQELGFTTLGFESSFYGLYQAQRILAVGRRPAQECLGKSVFPIWMNSQEFQPVVDLVDQHKLKVMGFDPQLNGFYSTQLVDSLDAILREVPARIPTTYLREVISVMSTQFRFPTTHQYPQFTAVIDKILAIVGRFEANPARQDQAAFWRQCLTSIRGLAQDYVLHNPNAKSAATFRAQDSNPRDQLMADNLLWYLREHPTEKVICWGATAHFSLDPTALDNEELQAYRPMGGLMKAALPGQVYSVGITVGQGEHGLLGSLPSLVPLPAEGSAEAQLAELGTEYLFVPTQQPLFRVKATTSLFEYTPITGDWSRVVDGVLFLRTVHPPTQVMRKKEAVSKP